MRAILAHGARPRISQSQSALLNGSTVSLRNTTFSPLRRRITLGDAFTILLAPVLTTALVADVISKDRRRRIWDEKLAQVQQEIDALREREIQTCSAIHLSAIRVSAASQRRSYSTRSTAAQIRSTQNGLDDDLASGGESRPTSNQSSSTNVVPLAVLQRFENLLATKVGLQLLLHISTGVHPALPISTDGFSESAIVPRNMDTLLKKLADVNTALRELSTKLPVISVGLSAETVERQQLDAELSQLTWECRSGSISISDLIYGYTQTVMASQTGPSLDTYYNLVSTFSTLKAEVLTSIAMFPFMRSKQELSDRHVCNIILQYGNLKDLRRLDNFLYRLVQPDRGFGIATKWEVVVAGGVRVPVPLNRRPRMLDALVRAALQGDQPHKARAWATFHLENYGSIRRLAAMFNNFLQYCARHFNWADGQLWVQTAIAWSAIFARDSPQMLSRIVFRILDLCHSCNQHEQYDMILNAAVKAGIHITPLDNTRPDAFSDLARIIRDDWSSRSKENRSSSLDLKDVFEAAIAFQNEVAQVDSAIKNFVGVVDTDRLTTLLHRDTFTTLLSVDKPYLNKAGARSESQAVPSFSEYRPFIENAIRQPIDRQTKITDTIREQDTRQPDLPRRLSMLQEAHMRLMQRYEEQCEANHKLRVDKDERPSAVDSFSDFDTFQDPVFTQDRLQTENQQLQERNSQLQDKIAVLETRNLNISARLKDSQEKEHDLVEAANQLQSQLDTVKPRSLEAVFLEKENLRLRDETRMLSERYLLVLHERDNVQKDLAALKALRDGLESRRASDLHLLQQDNENLRLQLRAANTQYQKILKAGRAREEPVQKTMKNDEERTGDSKPEMGKWQLLEAQLRAAPFTSARPSKRNTREPLHSLDNARSANSESDRSNTEGAASQNMSNSRFSFSSS